MKEEELGEYYKHRASIARSANCPIHYVQPSGVYGVIKLSYVSQSPITLQMILSINSSVKSFIIFSINFAIPFYKQPNTSYLAIELYQQLHYIVAITMYNSLQCNYPINISISVQLQVRVRQYMTIDGCNCIVIIVGIRSVFKSLQLANIWHSKLTNAKLDICSRTSNNCNQYNYTNAHQLQQGKTCKSTPSENSPQA